MNLEEALKPAKHFEALLRQTLERGYWSSELENDATEKYWNPIPYQSIRSVARDMMRKMKRPFIIVHGKPEQGVTVIVPKRKYCAPIINHLHLVAPDNFKADYTAPVRAWHGFTYWHFQINDRQIAEHFINVHLKTPEVRKAMRLPVEVA